MEACCESDAAADAVAPHGMADRTFGRDMDRVGLDRLDLPRDRAGRCDRAADRRIGRQWKGPEDPDGSGNSISAPKRGAVEANVCSVRTTPLTCGCHASVATRMRIMLPAILRAACGSEQPSGTAGQVLISNVPSNRSITAVQLSSQSPQLM